MAGCQTAVYGGGDAAPESLATAFLVAGAKNAVGALWPVDDFAELDFTRRFYRRLAHETIADAVRDSQVEMLRSGDPLLASPAAWAAMQCYGPGT